MRQAETNRRNRGGYTLIEMLVVIAIIFTLAGILLPAVQKVRGRATDTQARNDISQLEQGIAGFKQTYGEDIPSGLLLTNNYGPQTTNGRLINNSRVCSESLAFVKRVWPNGVFSRQIGPVLYSGLTNFRAAHPGNGVTSTSFTGMDGIQTLVFCLQGPTGLGFGAPDPANMNGAKKGPFMDFKSKQISSSGQFLDPWGQPYVYFSSKNGNDYNYYRYLGNTADANYINTYSNSTGGYRPIAGGTLVNPIEVGSTSRYMNPHSYQILCAGANKQYGPGGNYVAGQGAYGLGGTGGDDLSNFTQRILASGE